MNIFNLFGNNQTTKLNRRYQSLIQEAMQAQRNGNIRLYSELSTKAESVLRELERLESSSNKSP